MLSVLPSHVLWKIRFNPAIIHCVGADYNDDDSNTKNRNRLTKTILNNWLVYFYEHTELHTRKTGREKKMLSKTF